MGEQLKSITEIIEKPTNSDREVMIAKVQQALQYQQLETAVQIGPNRWLLSVVIDGPTKANLDNLPTKLGRSPSEQIAALINRVIETRKRHK